MTQSLWVNPVHFTFTARRYVQAANTALLAEHAVAMADAQREAAQLRQQLAAARAWSDCVGFGRIVALYDRSTDLHQIHGHIRDLCF